MGEDRPAVVVLKFLEPDATRSGAGDTPLRLFLEGLTHAAFVDGNLDCVKEFRDSLAFVQYDLVR